LHKKHDKGSLKAIIAAGLGDQKLFQELAKSGLQGSNEFVMFLTPRESRGYRISFVIEGSQYVTTASPSKPWTCGILDFCNVRV